MFNPSEKVAAKPHEVSVSPAGVVATIFHELGISLESEIPITVDRP